MSKEWTHTTIKPLTLEQLQGMRGKWVWIVSPDKDLTVSGWAFVGKTHVYTYWEYEEDALVGRVAYNIFDYGAWLAYSHPPIQEDWLITAFDREYPKDVQAEGIAVHEAVAEEHCNRCAFIARCVSDDTFRPPFFAGARHAKRKF